MLTDYNDFNLLSDKWTLGFLFIKWYVSRDFAIDNKIPCLQMFDHL